MNLETYLDNYSDSKLSNKILSTYKYFGYNFEELFAQDLNLLLTNIYPHITSISKNSFRTT